MTSSVADWISQPIPSTTSFHPTDVRVTTRVHEHELQSCLFSCIHEGGHGLYDQGLDQRYFGTPLGDSVSLGIHESQSRLWENCVGRSRSFWRFFYPILQQTFQHQLRDVEIEQFYAAINRVKPSLIRVEADELTYNLHIMLRFEIEQALVENKTQPDDLPAIWNQKMKDYLGIVPTSDAEGVLQDVHWSFGAFGYFPTYTLGNLYSAQFFEQAKLEIPHLEDEIAAGRLLVLRRWLEQKIHRWGRMFTPAHLAQRVTGSTVSPEPLSQLRGKEVRRTLPTLTVDAGRLSYPIATLSFAAMVGDNATSACTSIRCGTSSVVWKTISRMGILRSGSWGVLS